MAVAAEEVQRPIEIPNAWMAAELSHQEHGAGLESLEALLEAPLEESLALVRRA